MRVFEDPLVEADAWAPELKLIIVGWHRWADRVANKAAIGDET
jgi:hypothetical protein